MGSNKVEVRGCCMGIPFGCGTLFVLFLGFAASATPHVSLLAVSVGLAVAFCVGIAFLSVLGGMHEKRLRLARLPNTPQSK